MIILNINHPFYDKLIKLLEGDDSNLGQDQELELSDKNDILDALKLVIMAWARYEDEQPDGYPKNQAQEARADWGRIAKRFLERK